MQDETMLARIVIDNRTHTVYFRRVFCGETGNRYLVYHEIEAIICTGDSSVREIQGHGFGIDLQIALENAMFGAPGILFNTANEAVTRELCL